jgi:hypothetical protein
LRKKFVPKNFVSAPDDELADGLEGRRMLSDLSKCFGLKQVEARCTGGVENLLQCNRKHQRAGFERHAAQHKSEFAPMFFGEIFCDTRALFPTRTRHAGL